MNSNELYQLWDEFLESWPVQRVEAMTLEEYTKAGDPDSFMNWVEFRTKPLATISGTSSFIFGIYSRKDQTAKSNTKIISMKINMLGELLMVAPRRVLFSM